MHHFGLRWWWFHVMTSSKTCWCSSGDGTGSFSSMLNCMHVFCAADFVLLMCASQQWKVFEDEQTENWMVLAGENTDCPDPMENQLFNPAPNYINCRQKQFFIHWTNNLHILDLSDYRNVIFYTAYTSTASHSCVYDWNGRLEPFTIYHNTYHVP